MATQPPHRSQAGGAFLSDVFAHADPETAEFMARHQALLERVAVLEAGIEAALANLQAVFDPVVMGKTDLVRSAIAMLKDAHDGA